MVRLPKMFLFIFCTFACNIISVTAAEKHILWRDDCRCGESNPLDDGSPGECNPKSRKPCCSDYVDGWCGGSDLHCYCLGCVDYRDPAKEDEELVVFTKTEALKICYEVEEVGPCQERHRRWWYNTTTNQCQIFYWTGCHGNRNNFKTRYECEHTCFNIETYVIEALVNEFLVNETLALLNSNETVSKPHKKENKCQHVRCRPGAACNGTNGKCECMPSHTGDPYSFKGCTKILLVAHVNMELRQTPTEELTTIIEGSFCSDLLMTRDTEFCNYTNDVGYKDDSTTVQYMECADYRKVKGHCLVVEEFTGADDSTTTIKLRISIEEVWLKKSYNIGIPIIQFIKERINMLPGIFDPAANSLIWLNRAMDSSQIIAMKWDSIRIVGGKVSETMVPINEIGINLKDTFASDMCQDLVEESICMDLIQEDNLYCHADTGDDLCRKACGGCQAYTGNETCFNTVDFCRELVKRNACNTHKADMTILCPYTCGFCDEKADMYGPGGICDDLNNNCALIKDTYGCGNKFVQYHKQNLQCQKTCGLCDPTGSTVEDEDYEVHFEEPEYHEVKAIADNSLYQGQPYF